jgi:putative hydrolase of HD superfamily
MYTEDEFKNNQNRDGKLVKAADDLAAYIEAYLSIENGIHNENLKDALQKIRLKYRMENIMGIDFENLYLEFEA